MPIGIDQDGNVIRIPYSPLEGALQGAMEGAADSAPIQALKRILGGFGHVASAPARAVNAVGHNIAGLGPSMDVSDVALYGQDMNTGASPDGYGTLLRKVGFGEDDTSKIGGVVEGAGNVVGDPLTASLAGSLAGSGARAGAGKLASPAAKRRAGNFRPTDRAVQDVADHGVQFNRKPAKAYPSSPSDLLDKDLVNPGPNTKLGIKKGIPRGSNQAKAANRQKTNQGKPLETPAGSATPDQGLVDELMTVFSGGPSGTFWSTNPERAASYGPVRQVQIPRKVFNEGRTEAARLGQPTPQDTVLSPAWSNRAIDAPHIRPTIHEAEALSPDLVDQLLTSLGVKRF